MGSVMASPICSATIRRCSLPSLVVVVQIGDVLHVQPERAGDGLALLQEHPALAAVQLVPPLARHLHHVEERFERDPTRLQLLGDVRRGRERLSGYALYHLNQFHGFCAKNQAPTIASSTS